MMILHLLHHQLLLCLLRLVSLHHLVCLRLQLLRQLLHHLHLLHRLHGLLVHQPGLLLHLLRIHLRLHLLHLLLALVLPQHTSQPKVAVVLGPTLLSLARSSLRVPLVLKALSMSELLNARTWCPSVFAFALHRLLHLLYQSQSAPHHLIHSLRLQLMHQLLLASVECSPTILALPHQVLPPQTTSSTS